MEALEELMGDAHIIKGKRTKRQRLQSPIPFSIATYDLPGGDGENAYSSAELAESATTEEEEEDMVANCLILLAQGGSVDMKSSRPGNCSDHGITTGFRYTRQALGGHMRRHRIPGGTNTTLSLSPIGCEYEDREAKKQRNALSLSPLSAIGGESEDQEAKKQRIVLSLDLDLNLPAPLEDQVGESKFAFASKEQPQQQQQQQQQLQPPPLVLSTRPTLVDCQY
ncbi:hypothetical protein C3L33_16802, partial [Rhododendron williamsianum]